MQHVVMNFASWHQSILFFYSFFFFFNHLNSNRTPRRSYFWLLWLVVLFLPSENIFPAAKSSFPITPGAVTQNYLCSILYLPGQTKAWECFQSQEGEAPWVGLDASWHLLFPSLCPTTKGAEGRHTKPESDNLNQWQITWECITPCYPSTIRSHGP